MRIESISQVASLYKTTKTSAKYNVNAASYGRDYLSISQTGQDYQIAKQAVAETSDIREDKVSRLKNKRFCRKTFSTLQCNEQLSKE